MKNIWMELHGSITSADPGGKSSGDTPIRPRNRLNNPLANVTRLATWLPLAVVMLTY